MKIETMNKKIVRLTESDLHRVIKESVKKVIKTKHKINEGLNMPTKTFFVHTDGNGDVIKSCYGNPFEYMQQLCLEWTSGESSNIEECFEENTYNAGVTHFVETNGDTTIDVYDNVEKM